MFLNLSSSFLQNIFLSNIPLGQSFSAILNLLSYIKYSKSYGG